MPGTDRCHRLDIVMDVRKPHQTWVADMLTLYRSALIYSGGTWKVVSDRSDLPVRQVFHSGNMVPDRTEIKIGGDPLRPNQVTVDFLNRSLNYQRDTKYAQDSASIYGRGEAIRNLDVSMIGITREAEVLRAADMIITRKSDILREVTWATGLEALAVEPGDVAAVGIVTRDFEMGWGGRVLDGSSSHVVLDREVTVKSGYAYELFVWHTQADTPERRTVATTVPSGASSFTTITVSPTAGFSYQALAGDRWAMGITSEDLMRVRVKSIRRSQDGLHELVGEQYVAIDFTIECPGSITTAVSNSPPSQPSTASITASGCVLCANVATVPSCVGGLLTVPGTLGSVTLNSSHNPNVAALVGDRLFFTTGPASGATSTVSAWGGSGSNVATVSNAFSASSVPDSGNSYYVAYRTPPFTGMEVEVDSGGGYGFVGRIFNTSGCVSIRNTAELLGVRLTPYSDRGQVNTIGRWVQSVTAYGCADPEIITTVATVTGSAETVLYAYNLVGNDLGTFNRVNMRISALVTEACSPAFERTDMFLSLRYGSQVLISSLAARLGDTGAFGTQEHYGHGTYGGLSQLGSNRAAFIEANLYADGVTSRQTATLKYAGPLEQDPAEILRSGTGTVDSTLTQTVAITAQFSHLNSAGAVHSHGCFFLVFRSGVSEITSL